MLSDKAMHERMAKGWSGGKSGGTICGGGSLRQHTLNARKWLPIIVKHYGIKSVCDAGAGDLHWIKLVDWDVDYKAYDLIPRVDGVEKLDITTQNMPPCDAILCRMVLNHLWGEGNDDMRIIMALERFKMSAKYLIATQFDANKPKRSAQFTRVDLEHYLGRPLEQVKDGHEDGCRLSIWEL